VEVLLHAFLTLALDGDEWSASRSGRFTPKEIASSTHFIIIIIIIIIYSSFAPHGA